MGLGLLYLIVLAGLALIAVAVVGSAYRGDGSRKELRAERAKNAIYARTIRQIASGSVGNPTYEAQDALDKVEALEMKELT